MCRENDVASLETSEKIAQLKRKYVEAVSSNNSSWDVTRNSIVIFPT